MAKKKSSLELFDLMRNQDADLSGATKNFTHETAELKSARVPLKGAGTATSGTEPALPCPPSPRTDSLGERSIRLSYNSAVLGTLLILGLMLGSYAFGRIQGPSKASPLFTLEKVNPVRIVGKGQARNPMERTPLARSVGRTLPRGSSLDNPRTPSEPVQTGLDAYSVVLMYWTADTREQKKKAEKIYNAHVKEIERQGYTAHKVHFSENGKHFIGIAVGAFDSPRGDKANRFLAKAKTLEFRGRTVYKRSASFKKIY